MGGWAGGQRPLPMRSAHLGRAASSVIARFLNCLVAPVGLPVLWACSLAVAGRPPTEPCHPPCHPHPAPVRVCCAVLVLVRDSGCGRVAIDRSGRPRIHYTLAPADEASMLRVRAGQRGGRAGRRALLPACVCGCCLFGCVRWGALGCGRARARAHSFAFSALLLFTEHSPGPAQQLGKAPGVAH